MEKYVFIERDGVVNVQQDTPVTSIEELAFMPFAFEAFALLFQSGIKPILLTVQEGLVQGTLTHPQITEVHREIRAAIQENGGLVHDIFYCPAEGIPYEKFRYPSSNLLRLAAGKHTIDLRSTFFLTNRYAALQAGWEARCKTIFVRSGKVYDEKRRLVDSDSQPDFNVKDIMAGVHRVVEAYSTTS